MVFGLRWRLLLYQLSVMGTILGLFGLGVYGLFSRSLYQQLDQKLMTLAQAATPSMKAVSTQGDRYLDQLDEVPWRDIFNRNQQSLEWFDVSGRRLAKRGEIDLSAPPVLGPQTVHPDQSSPDGVDTQIRAFTVSVFEDPVDANRSPTLRGYIRASQTTASITLAQRQLLGGLALGGGLTLVLVGIGGVWLTRVSLQPIQRSYRQLKQFTADASHELRGPLTAISTSVELIQKHPERIHAKDIKKLNAITSATHQLRMLAEDLLLLARMDAEQVVARTWLVCLNTCLQDTLTLYANLAQAKGIQLQLEAPVRVTVVGDPGQYNRLFSNLVQNALSYTETGRVVVRLSRFRRYAQVQIEDTGMGIAPQDLPHIFDRFWRADKARSHRAGGSGLGLAIAQAITHQHGGRIWVTSQPQVGSCFYVRLPLVERGDG